MTTTDSPSPSAEAHFDWPLPSFIVRQEAGWQIDLAQLSSPAALNTFIDRVFGAGFCLGGGDYAVLQSLLYAHEPEVWQERIQALRQQGPNHPWLCRLGPQAFSDARRLLYRGWSIDDKKEQASFLFEPLYCDREEQIPVLSEPDAQGQQSIDHYDTQTVSERVALQLDEFIAACWMRGIRFGWDLARIEQAIAQHSQAGHSANKIVIAHAQAAIPGTDATVQELEKSLHRNDRPRILSNGRVDLAQFRNHFPQVKKDTRLIKKIPRTAGRCGFDVTGLALQPNIGQDFNIETLAGAGVRVDRLADGEYLVAAKDGFLSIDTGSHQFSISEKMINHEGVSVRTTGNLHLQGEEFEEHGEVQEKRTVEGLHMTFMADVYGHIISRGGRIVLQRYFAGGSAQSHGGSIEVAGRASRVLIDARGGEVHVKFAENSMIIGRKVVIEHACLCDIVGEEISINRAEGCVIAGQAIHIEQAGARKEVETSIMIMAPNLSSQTQKLEEWAQKQAQLQNLLTQLEAKSLALLQLPELKTFLMLQKNRASAQIKFSPEQEQQFRVLTQKAAPHLKKYNEIKQVLQEQQHNLQQLQQEQQRLRQEQQAQLARLRCDLQGIEGEVRVHSHHPRSDETPLEQLPQRELHMRLHGHSQGNSPLFASDSGEWHWQWPIAN